MDQNDMRFYTISYTIHLTSTIFNTPWCIWFLCPFFLMSFIFFPRFSYIFYTFSISFPIVLAKSGASGKRLTGSGPFKEKPWVPRSKWRHTALSASSGSNPGGSTWQAQKMMTRMVPTDENSKFTLWKWMELEYVGIYFSFKYFFWGPGKTAYFSGASSLLVFWGG